MIFLYRIGKIFFVYYYYLWIGIESFLGCWILMLEVDAIGIVPSSNFYGTVRYLLTLSSLVLLAD